MSSPFSNYSFPLSLSTTPLSITPLSINPSPLHNHLSSILSLLESYQRVHLVGYPNLNLVSDLYKELSKIYTVNLVSEKLSKKSNKPLLNFLVGPFDKSTDYLNFLKPDKLLVFTPTFSFPLDVTYEFSVYLPPVEIIYQENQDWLSNINKIYANLSGNILIFVPDGFLDTILTLPLPFEILKEKVLKEKKGRTVYITTNSFSKSPDISVDVVIDTGMNWGLVETAMGYARLYRPVSNVEADGRARMGKVCYRFTRPLAEINWRATLDTVLQQIAVDTMIYLKC